MNSQALLQNNLERLPDQHHLDYSKRVNLGGYYTQSEYVSVVWDFIRPFLTPGSYVFDSSCGYGNFLRQLPGIHIVGNDIDFAATQIAKQNKPFAEIYAFNALMTFDRASYGIPDDTPLFIIGNPPYNDTTSIIRNGTKKLLFEVDPAVQSRDLGISFLLSYGRLQADYVCVLHPLSYLIKRTNFMSMKSFAESYRLANSMIISSGVFSETSKTMQFPIIIALYEKNLFGMDYAHIRSYEFNTVEGRRFSMNQFDFIGDHITKYPSRNFTQPDNDAILFYTMRDLNALKRNRTFLDKYETNAIVVRPDKLIYYIYADVVKEFSWCFPYYFGNFDVLLKNDLLMKYKDFFISNALSRNQFLRKFYPEFKIIDGADLKIIEYFKLLLGEHYVEGKNY